MVLAKLISLFCFTVCGLLVALLLVTPDPRLEPVGPISEHLCLSLLPRPPRDARTHDAGAHMTNKLGFPCVRKHGRRPYVSVFASAPPFPVCF